MKKIIHALEVIASIFQFIFIKFLIYLIKLITENYLSTLNIMIMMSGGYN